MNIQKGKILLASPFLGGKYFKCSVILIVDNGDHGYLGLTLNKALKVDVEQVIVPSSNVFAPVYLGGPVDNQLLFFIHTRPDIIPRSIKLKDNLYWSGDFSVVLKLIGKGVLNDTEIKFFSGYAGWSVEMLHDEINDKSWFAVDFDPETIMSHDTETMWEKGISKLDGNLKLLSKFPRGFNMN